MSKTLKTEITSELTHEKAVELANEIFRLESTVKNMKEQLREYVKENGELVAGDKVWKFRENVSWNFNDSEKIKDFLKSLVIDGITYDPYSLISFPKTKLNKLGIDDDYISAFAEKRVTKSFVNQVYRP